MKFTRNIIPFFILATFILVAFNYTFFLVIESSQKSKFRKELMLGSPCVQAKSVDKRNLYTNSKGLEWCDDNKELLINGEFFEVIGIHEQGELATIYLLKDTQENELFSSYFSKQKKNNDLLVNIIKLLSGLDQPTRDMAAIHIDCAITENVTHEECCLPAGYTLGLIKPPLA